MADLKPFFDSYKSSGFPVDIRQVVRRVGLELDDTANLHDDIAGQVERVSDAGNKFKISVSKDLDDLWKNFVMAHELGHYVLHESLIGDGLDDNAAFFSNPKGEYNNQNIGVKQEVEAHTFAAKILMPEKEISRFFDSFLKDKSKEKQPELHFGVPSRVISWWLKVLREKSELDPLVD